MRQRDSTEEQKGVQSTDYIEGYMLLATTLSVVICLSVHNAVA